jgi:hypothetical protein
MTDFKVEISSKATMISVNLNNKKIVLPKNRGYNLKDLSLLDHELATHAYR